MSDDERLPGRSTSTDARSADFPQGIPLWHAPRADRRTGLAMSRGQTMQESPSQDGPPPIVARGCSVQACSSAASSTSCGWAPETP